MKEIYQQYGIEGIILVDASTYRNTSQLFVIGGGEILSKEGTTQGDNLVMSFYGLGTKPLLDKFPKQLPQVKKSMAC